MEKLQDFHSIIFTSGGYNGPITLLTDIRTFWASNKNFWFSHTPIESWPTYDTVYEDTLGNNMSILLHYDQIYRHPNHLITDESKKIAARFATHIALKMLHNGQYATAQPHEKVFILLALRHNSSLPLKELALTKLLQLVTEESSTPNQLYIRFLNATIWDIHSTKHTCGYLPELSIVDTQDSFHNILQSPTHNPEYDPQTTYDHLYTLFEDAIITQDSSTIAVSISGGVDSMVCAHIARIVCNRHNKRLILLHINYNNRECCEQECDLLRFFSQSIGVPLYIRKITELQRIRTSSLRTLYEDITRRIRFSFYSYFNCPVILGHNRDDCFENVFTNLSKQIHYENLFGMRTCSSEQGVTVLRPMLSVAKADIILFADHTNIPHLCDSTPAWSQRGQMRDKLIPAIHTFNPHILPGLEQFINHSIFLSQQWTVAFKQWVQSLKNNFIPYDTFFTSNYTQLNFWIQLWQHLGLTNRPSNKSFHNLIDTIQKGSRTNGKCSLNKQWSITFHKSAGMYIVQHGETA